MMDESGAMKNLFCKNALGSRLKTEGDNLEPRALSLEQGLSLIELLIASVIVASAAALLLGGLIAANRGSDIRIEQALSTQALASELAQLDEPLASDISTSGVCTLLKDGCQWTLSWVQAPLDPLVAATLTVRLNGHAYRLVTYRSLAQPPQAP